MSEQYKPWEGRHYKYSFKNVCKKIRDLSNCFNEDCNIDFHANSIFESLVEIEIALKKDWDEQGKDEKHI